MKGGNKRSTKGYDRQSGKTVAVRYDKSVLMILVDRLLGITRLHHTRMRGIRAAVTRMHGCEGKRAFRLPFSPSAIGGEQRD